MSRSDDPHGDQPVAMAGPPPGSADAALVLVHGRGGSAAGMLPFGREVVHRAGLPGRVGLRAPQATDLEWYPRSFLAPVEENEPGLSSALAALDRTVESLAEDGLIPERIVVLGFSQGACLAIEYVARSGGRWGGLVGLAGGLIGDEVDRGRYVAPLEATPAFLGAGERDRIVSLERVRETAEVLEELGADVDLRTYPDLGHALNDDELDRAAEILRAAVDGSAAIE